MKNLKFIYTIIAFCLVNLSCSDDYLERYPLDSPSDETFLSNEAELEMAVAGAYNALWYHPAGIAIPFSITFDYASDIGWERNTTDLQALGLGLVDSDNEYTAGFWTAFYRGIGRCNSILDKSESLKEIVPQEKYDRLISEVRFLRAFYYFYLSELYGGVPLLTANVTLSEARIAKSPKSEITDFILSELDAILPTLLPETNTANKGRASVGAALALKSRVALYNERWDVAAAAASDLMELGNYSLHGKFDELFSYAGQSSREIIFAVQYLNGLQEHPIPFQFYSRIASGTSNKIPVQSLVDSYESIDGLSIDKSPLYDPAKPFANRDPRLNYTIVLPQTRFINYMFETHSDSLMTWNYNTNPATRVSNTDVTNAYATFSGYLWRKYADIADKDDRSSDMNVILFRYAEVLLNYAEAKVELNEIDESVYAAINAVRQRPSVNMPPIQTGKSQAQLISIIRKERKYEFAAEGLRFFDIRRWGIAHEVMPGKLLGRIRNGYLSSAPRIDENGTPHYENVANSGQMRVIETRNYNKDRDYLWPIPRLETEVNPLLVQNPNY